MAEFLDIRTPDGEPTGRVVRRGDAMQPGECFLTVSVWVRDAQGRYLLSRRAPDISRGGMWQTTEGCVVAGEDSLTGALREVREELGMRLLPEKGRLWHAYPWPHPKHDGTILYNVWLFEQEAALEDLCLQAEEVCDAKWVTADELRGMVARGEFPPLDYLEKLFAEP